MCICNVYKHSNNIQVYEQLWDVAFCINIISLFTYFKIKWSGRNQKGAGTTAGEEVEQVNSYLSRCALLTKYMLKAGD